MKVSNSIGITAPTYELPRKRATIEDVTSEASARRLRSFGFENVWITEDEEELYLLMLRSAQKTLALVDKADVEAVILYSGVPAERPIDSGVDIFRYFLPRLLHDLKMSGCRSYALAQQGCSGVVSTMELGVDLLRSSSKRYVLCIAGDRLPQNMDREIIYNAVSDAAGAFLMERDSSFDTIIAIHQRSNAALWDTSHMEEEILAMYFPMATRAIRDALAHANISADEVAWFVPHNVSIRSWEMLAKLVPLVFEKVWLENVPRIGHTVSCDHIINMHDMHERGLIAKSDIVFLFTFGFGAQWSSVIIRH